MELSMMAPDPLDLTGKLLIAMPGMGDARFAHSIIFIAQHTHEGAMGLIVNKPAAGAKLSDVMDHLAPQIGSNGTELSIHIGGPVETERGFVLHSRDYESAINSMPVDDRFALTTTLDVLEDIAAGKGPEQAMLMLGYAGWGPDQLEGEIAQNGWLSCDASARLVFDLQDDQKWSAALQSLGIDPLGLSAAAGRA